MLEMTRIRCAHLALTFCFSVTALPAGSSFLLLAQNSAFHNAPASADKVNNPYAGQAHAVEAGKAVYQRNCGACHGNTGQGAGNVPPLARGSAQTASDGAIFWYVTQGDVNNGMPSWAGLPTKQRWQVVTFLKTLNNLHVTQANASVAPATTIKKSTAPPPNPPFTDYRFEKPGATRHIRVQDLPEPYATESATAGPKVVARPQNAWPKAPQGFKVELYATGLNNPRIIRTAPNGDFFLAETNGGDIKVFRGITVDGKPEQVQVFATGLNTPFGIAFCPPGPDPQWVYVANMDSVLRFPYHN